MHPAALQAAKLIRTLKMVRTFISLGEAAGLLSLGWRISFRARMVLQAPAEANREKRIAMSTRGTGQLRTTSRVEQFATHLRTTFPTLAVLSASR